MVISKHKGVHVRGNSGRNYTQGFALVEALLVVIILAALVGVGIYVVHRQPHANTPTATGSTVPVANGTTESINQLTQQDAQIEAGVDSASDSQAQQTSMSANGALNNVAGAYDENNL